MRMADRRKAPGLRATVFVLALALAGCEQLPDLPDLPDLGFGGSSASSGAGGGGGWVSGRTPIGSVTVSGNQVNLRAGPGTRFAVVGSASSGRRFDVLRRTGGWIEVVRGERTAWIAEELTSDAGAASTGTGVVTEETTPASSARESGPAILPDLETPAPPASNEAADAPAEEGPNLLPEMGGTPSETRPGRDGVLPDF